MKKIFLFIIFLGLTLSLVACGKPAAVVNRINQNQEVAETGKVLDISDKNDQTINAVPGDIIYLKLNGKNDKDYLWSVASSTSMDSFILKDHKIGGLGQANNSTTTSEWWLKVEKKGDLVLQFSYGKINKPIEKLFKAIIISQ